MRINVLSSWRTCCFWDCWKLLIVYRNMCRLYVRCCQLAPPDHIIRFPRSLKAYGSFSIVWWTNCLISLKAIASEDQVSLRDNSMFFNVFIFASFRLFSLQRMWADHYDSVAEKPGRDSILSQMCSIYYSRSQKACGLGAAVFQKICFLRHRILAPHNLYRW
jgi:hypothetical protein